VLCDGIGDLLFGQPLFQPSLVHLVDGCVVILRNDSAEFIVVGKTSSADVVTLAFLVFPKVSVLRVFVTGLADHKPSSSRV